MHFANVIGDDYADAAHIFEEIHRLRHIGTLFEAEPPLKKSDLMMLFAIGHLEAVSDQKITVSALAKETHQSMPGVSQKVSILENLGYIQRSGDKDDRRVVYIEITKAGQLLGAKALRTFLSGLQQSLASLGPEKTKLLLSLLRELIDNVESTQQKNKK